MHLPYNTVVIWKSNFPTSWNEKHWSLYTPIHLSTDLNFTCFAGIARFWLINICLSTYEQEAVDGMLLSTFGLWFCRCFGCGRAWWCTLSPALLYCIASVLTCYCTFTVWWHFMWGDVMWWVWLISLSISCIKCYRVIPGISNVVSCPQKTCQPHAKCRSGYWQLNCSKMKLGMELCVSLPVFVSVL